MKSFPTKSVLALALASISSGAAAHGYVSETNGGVAASRSALCKYPTPDTNEKIITAVRFNMNRKALKALMAFPKQGLAMVK